jgi:GAF domain-containing protein
MTAPISQHEKKRLKVLWQYEVLDTVPEEVFDDLTELAAQICEAPIALISLVDEKRQWFKSKVGISVSETSRDLSFCAHAIKQCELFIVPDAAQDERFASNPLVTSDPKIRFYAGAPLITPDGYALGTLCVIDKVPRELRPEQKQALRTLARHVVTQLELRRRSRELGDIRRENADLKSDLEKARAALAAACRPKAAKSRK